MPYRIAGIDVHKRMLAVVVMIALIGVSLYWLVTLLRDRLVFWEKLDSYYAE